MELVLERRGQENRTPNFGGVMLTPPVGDDYWSHRVCVGGGQAVVAFPKFSTIGIGFAVEDVDWNTNLPWTMGTDEIFNHIIHNKNPKDLCDGESIADEDCRQAIVMLQEALLADGADAGWRDK